MQNPATILSAATAVPGTVVTAAQTKQILAQAFELDERRLASVHSVIDHARVSQRYTVFPPEYTVTPRPLEKVSCEYKTNAIALGQRAAEAALAEANLAPTDIDLIITVSCTGLMIPSLDVYLANLMGFRDDVKRLPITSLGCAAGAAGLARAADFLRGSPEAHVLLVAVELPTLTFQRDDPSPANLISCCLFGDGAGAVVLSGPSARGLSIVDSLSRLIPGSPHAMGFDLRSTGLHVILSKEVPALVKQHAGPAVDAILARNRLSREDVSFFVLHPGGQKLLSGIEEEFAIDPALTAPVWDVLDRHGNMSAATVLFVLREFLKGPKPAPGSRGLLAAFGPGFSIEVSLLQWN